MRNRVFLTCFRTGLAIALVVAVPALTVPTHLFASVPLVPISGLSPYPDGGDPNDPVAVTQCNGGPQIGVLYRNSETEPYIAVNPTNSDNLIACWHQDRWSTGSGQGVGCAYSMDGGNTWTFVNIPFTNCSGGAHGGDDDDDEGGSFVAFERASDPWLTFGPDGLCYYMALVSDRSSGRNGMAVAKSKDGGRTWSRPRMIALHDPTADMDDDDDDGHMWSQPGLAIPHEMLTPEIPQGKRKDWLRTPNIFRGPIPITPGNNDEDDDDGDDGDSDDDGDDGDDGGAPPEPQFVFHDKNSMTADPHNSRYVYATWTLFLDNTTQIVFSRSKNRGRTWSKFREIATQVDVDENTIVGFRQGPQIVVLPDGTLVNAFYRVLLDRMGNFVGTDQAIVRSYDRGKTWEKNDTKVADFEPTGGVDAEYFFIQGIFLPVRDAGLLPDIAVNNDTGDLYIVWQDGGFREFGASTVVISRSTDGGDTWSTPVPVHDIPDPPGMPGQSFLPSVAVTDDGRVGVQFYDFRNDVFFDGPLSTDVFLSVMDADLNPIVEERITDESMDMRQMVLTGDRGYFPGDYVGFYADGDEFVAAITVSNPLGLPVDFPQDNTILQVDSNNRQDILFARMSGKRPKDEGDDAPILAEGPETNRYVLHAATPNPFNPSTTITFELAEETAVLLEIFDVAGRRVRALVSGDRMSPGPHSVIWDGRVKNGQTAATGVYFYRLMTASFTETRRMVLLK